MTNLSTAIFDFRHARRRAKLQKIMARFTGGAESLELLAYEDVREKLRAYNKVDRGLQTIPLEAIIGSVGRYKDFTRTFLPREDSDEQRWAQVKVAQTTYGLPPISVYQIGDAYFVQDGNHRVSIARQEGSATIEAYVSELQTTVPFTPDVQPDDLIVKAEYADFLAHTQLDKLRSDTDLTLTSPGKYPLLLEHIELHRYYLGLERQRDIPYEEAVIHWHDTVYMPIIRFIQQQGVMHEFPGRTETDLYIWLAEHRAEIEKDLGLEVSTVKAVSDLVSQFGKYKPHHIFDRMIQLVTSQEEKPSLAQWWRERHKVAPNPQLFNTILVPITSKDTGWHALGQALQWAKREKCQVIGLYIVEDEQEKKGVVSQTMQSEFQKRAAAMNVAAHFRIETGAIEPIARQLAHWTDLVVLPVPATSGSIGWDMLRRLPRLTLMVPEGSGHIDAILLVPNTTNDSKEIIFLAAYLSHQWQVPLMLLVTKESEEEVVGVLAGYDLDLQLDILAAATITVEAILSTITSYQVGLIIMGGNVSGVAPTKLPGTIKQVLQKSSIPLLIHQ